MASHLASDKNLKESAQRAFQAYIKSVFLMRNKSIFQVPGYRYPSCPTGTEPKYLSNVLFPTRYPVLFSFTIFGFFPLENK
jgi:hypothetical protein